MNKTSYHIKTAAKTLLLVVAFAACGKKSSNSTTSNNNASNTEALVVSEWQAVKDFTGSIRNGAFEYNEITHAFSFVTSYYDFDQLNTKGEPITSNIYVTGTVGANRSLVFKNTITGFNISGSCMDTECTEATLFLDKTNGKLQGTTEYAYKRIASHYTFGIDGKNRFMDLLSDYHDNYRAQAITSIRNNMKINVEVIFHLYDYPNAFIRRLSMSGAVGKDQNYFVSINDYQSNGQLNAGGGIGEAGNKVDISYDPNDYSRIKFEFYNNTSFAMYLR